MNSIDELSSCLFFLLKLNPEKKWNTQNLWERLKQIHRAITRCVILRLRRLSASTDQKTIEYC